MINKEYSDLVFRQQALINKRDKNINEDFEFHQNAKLLTSMELKMTAQDIILSIREAFKHIPARN